jgi:divalent metal cation (Fe/Co/Zn/Cd) transporter
MGRLHNIFSLVFGINLIVVGAVAFISGIVSLVKRDGSVRKPTAIAYIIAGGAAVYFGVVLSRSGYKM